MQKLHNENLGEILKIPPLKPRIKDTDSLITKTLYRKKYDNPYDDVTDKVGIRFVVLLVEDIEHITKIIDSAPSELWKSSKDKDFEIEWQEHPELFTYESVHYVVYNSQERTCNDTSLVIPANIPCEIQIRTLLQHAYAEMSHDNIYKPTVEAKPEVKRIMARSMALIESADHFFSQAISELNEQSKQHISWLSVCEKYYKLPIKNPDASMYLLDQIIPLLGQDTPEAVSEYLSKNSALVELVVKQKYNSSWLYQQPALVLIIYLAKNRSHLLQSSWPFTEDLLSPLLTLLGISKLYSS